MPIEAINAVAQAAQAQAAAIQNPAQIQGIGSLGDEAKIGLDATTSAAKPVSFSDQLAGAVQNLNATQATADAQSQALATGQTTDVTQVVVAVERAQLELQMATTIRNKLVDAFNELQRTQV